MKSFYISAAWLNIYNFIVCTNLEAEKALSKMKIFEVHPPCAMLHSLLQFCKEVTHLPVLHPLEKVGALAGH